MQSLQHCLRSMLITVVVARHVNENNEPAIDCPPVLVRARINRRKGAKRAFEVGSKRREAGMGKVRSFIRSGGGSKKVGSGKSKIEMKNFLSV